MSDDPKRDPKPVIMPHAYDGIQEYDQSLPNWWLFTLFGSIAFAFLYWLANFVTGTVADDRVALNAELAALEARQLAAVKNLDEATLWKMSRNTKAVADGQAVYASLCFSCHGLQHVAALCVRILVGVTDGQGRCWRGGGGGNDEEYIIISVNFT